MTMVWIWEFQQTTEPSLFTPQVSLPLVLTEENFPSGGVASE